MADSIEEAIAEAIAEIKTKEWVIDAEQDTSFSEEKPCNFVMKLLNVIHQTSSGDYTFSHKGLYINKTDFTWYWHYGGGAMESISTPFKDLLESKIPALKTQFDVDWAEITEADEIKESGLVTCIKTTSGNLADTYIVKAWKIDDTTVGAKIVEHITVS